MRSRSNPIKPPRTRPRSLPAAYQRLHEFYVVVRWGVVALLWLCVGLPCLGLIWDEIALWREYFTWTAVRYTIAYNRWEALGLSLCIGMTLSTLLWQSRNILWGMSLPEHRQLRQQMHQIRRQGKRHPLWRWVTRDDR